MRLWLARPAALAALLLVSACGGAEPPQATSVPALLPDQPKPLTVTGGFRHAASGMQFPTDVGGFERVAVIQYDRDGLVVSAGYTTEAPAVPIAATIYVYPPVPGAGTRDALCRREFAARVADILRTYPGATLIEQTDTVLQQVDAPHPGHRALFAYQTELGGVRRPVSSALHLFCFAAGRWQVQYRFTYPEGAAAAPVIDDFMRRLGWTFGGGMAARPPLDRSTDPAG
jgi:hypothetical protein